METAQQAADRLTGLLARSDWTASRAHIEGARNALANAAADLARLRAALDRLQAAYNNKEISGSLWDKEQHCYVSLPVFFSRAFEQSEEKAKP